MKLRRFFSILTALLLVIAPAAQAQEAMTSGALTAAQLEAWAIGLKEACAGQQLLNDPVGEESRTNAGYAFLYDAATLYYQQASTDSPLLAVALTDAAQKDPRGIGVGDDQSLLLEAYGWQNPTLLGDGSVAAFYLEDERPQQVRWSWAIHEDGRLLSVQCVVHQLLQEDQYTDMGIIYQLIDGKVERIQVYGLGRNAISAAAVSDNVEAVTQSMALISGDEPVAASQWPANEAPAFGPEDLVFSGLDFRTLNEQVLTALYGQADSLQAVPDADGLSYVTAQRDGLMVGYLQDEAGNVVRTESLAMTTPSIAGPRGLRVGMTLEEAVSRFRCDGTQQTLGSATLLYGDGQAAPYGMEEPDGMGGTTLRYLTEVPDTALTVTLMLTFQQDLLTEIYLYAW